MTSGYRYKHENCLDMSMYIIKRTYVGPTYAKYRVLYTDDSGARHAGGSEIVKVYNKDLKKWKFVE
jgi:hypothetical protein